ncbi:MAG: HD domain-containing phosphohydrolase [Armatimonadota bacterium]
MSNTTNNNKNILIVSSSGTLRKRLDEGLKAIGYNTASAPDGETALIMLKRQKVDLSITSLDLMGMNGIQLCRAIIRVHPNLPVVVMSQSPDAQQVALALSGGAADLVSESTTPEEMVSVIEHNIERRVAPTRRIVSDRAETLFKTIRILTAAIDAKSHFAARHSSRVTQLSMVIAKRLGLSEDQMATLELAAQLHDIGKIGTPDNVLTKPDVLTDDEWVDVLKHPAMGSTFLAGIPELMEVSSVVRHHHENFDGTGYPDGLQGEAIPLLSRIISVADAYEAMTSERPYRQAKTHEQAAEELRRNSGKQFDAVMVEHLLSYFSDNNERKAA